MVRYGDCVDSRLCWGDWVKGGGGIVCWGDRVKGWIVRGDCVGWIGKSGEWGELWVDRRLCGGLGKAGSGGIVC